MDTQQSLRVLVSMGESLVFHSSHVPSWYLWGSGGLYGPSPRWVGKVPTEDPRWKKVVLSNLWRIVGRPEFYVSRAGVV